MHLIQAFLFCPCVYRLLIHPVRLSSPSVSSLVHPFVGPFRYLSLSFKTDWVNGSLINQQSFISYQLKEVLKIIIYCIYSLCRIVETTPSPRPPDAETDSTGEGTDRRETTDIMSPDPDIAMDTSGVVPGEQDQALDTAKIEIIASTLEEICTFLNQAQHLIVSGLFLLTCMTSLMHCKNVLSMPDL